MLVHLNHQLVPAEQAKVSVFDRGFLFGDGVYEGLRVTRGGGGSVRVIGLGHHVERMRAGLAEARIQGFDPARLEEMTLELAAANGLDEAAVYWQISRGAPPAGAPLRARVPDPRSTPTVFGYAAAIKPVSAYTQPEVRRVSLRPDTRWTRGQLKSISLLGGVLAAIEADELGGDDAIMHKGGLITEGTATNVFIARGNRLITPSLDSAPMLAGVTRALILEEDPTIEVRPLAIEEFHAADEVMLTGTYTMVSAISTIDGTPVGGAHTRAPGPMACRLLELLHRAIARDTGTARTTPASSQPAQAAQPCST
ncbi:MAG: aminotransferase class IV [Phycisphaerales bacterium]